MASPTTEGSGGGDTSEWNTAEWYVRQGNSISWNDVRAANLTTFFSLLVSVEEKVKSPRRRWRRDRVACRTIQKSRNSV